MSRHMHERAIATIDETGDTVRLHRLDLPGIANPEQFDITLTYQEISSIYMELRARHLGLDDITGGL